MAQHQTQTQTQTQQQQRDLLGALGLEASTPLHAQLQMMMQHQQQQHQQQQQQPALAALLEQLARAQQQQLNSGKADDGDKTTTTTSTSLKRPLERSDADLEKKKVKTEGDSEEEMEMKKTGAKDEDAAAAASRKPQSASRQPSHNSASESSHSMSASEDDDDEDDEEDDEEEAGQKGRGGRMKGRFSQSERRLLFSIIREDPELLRSFLHQLKRRIWDGKSWMHEIGTRFNKRAKKKRSHDAVRHHLKLRRPQPTDSRAVVSAEEQEVTDFLHLLEHSSTCSRRDACARCLQLSRLRVRRGLARCGYPGCDKCDPTLPHVLEDFDVRALLRYTQQHEQHRHFHHQQQQRHHRLQLSTLNITNPALAASIRKADEEKERLQKQRQELAKQQQQVFDTLGPAPERRNSTGSTCSTTSVASNNHPSASMLLAQQQALLMPKFQQHQHQLQLPLPGANTNMADLIKFIGASNAALPVATPPQQQNESSHTATLMRLLQEQRDRQAMLGALLADANATRAAMPMTPVGSFPGLNFAASSNNNSVNPDPKVRPTPRAFSDFEVSLAETLAQASRKQN
ncbi:Hypothetical Protein FCC1311_018592 [Hondaea fermentalgiana]|uniref:Uncharacterized protein n=1 Tax=Hondaea fermentalgiana TaxID=2315210 RepID=A0A2R5G3P9_9STRA|nr:Hypothetical Protein FCC1311_018592 [Hondaea fermentalgiana]|eukprot:GBG25640.1 Hypothetical Protein FCC1311_018592 [Hondaea fermentalgiana]